MPKPPLTVEKAFQLLGDDVQTLERKVQDAELAMKAALVPSGPLASKALSEFAELRNALIGVLADMQEMDRAIRTRQRPGFNVPGKHGAASDTFGVVAS